MKENEGSDLTAMPLKCHWIAFTGLFEGQIPQTEVLIFFPDLYVCNTLASSRDMLTTSSDFDTILVIIVHAYGPY